MSPKWLALVGLAACGARTDLGGIEVRDASVDVVAVDVIDVLNPPDFAWYRLDETSGSTAHDSTPNHYDVNVGSVTWGGGATFTTNCGTVNVASSFRVAPVTISGWLTPASRSDEDANQYALTPFPPNALSGDVPSLGGFAMGLDVWTNAGGGNALAVETGVNASIAFHSVGASFASNTRYFVAEVIDSSSAAVYVDGALFTTVSADTPPSSSPVPLHLGCHNTDTGYGTKRFFQGRMRDMRVYKRLVSPIEIDELFANGPV